MSSSSLCFTLWTKFGRSGRGESSPQEGMTWDGVEVVGLEDSGLGEREDKLMVLWKSKLLQRLLFEDFHDHKPN